MVPAMDTQDEVWLDITHHGTPYEVQVEARTGRYRWREYAKAGEWIDGWPPAKVDG